MAPRPPSIDPPPPPCTGAGGGAELAAGVKLNLAPKTIVLKINCQKHNEAFSLLWKRTAYSFALVMEVIHKIDSNYTTANNYESISSIISNLPKKLVT